MLIKISELKTGGRFTNLAAELHQKVRASPNARQLIDPNVLFVEHIESHISVDIW